MVVRGRVRGALRAHRVLRVGPRPAHGRDARPEPRGPGRSSRCSSPRRSACASACSCRSASASSSGMSPHPDEFVAWSWAVNGFFSVIGSVLTIILAMSIGFRAVQGIALGDLRGRGARVPRPAPPRGRIADRSRRGRRPAVDRRARPADLTRRHVGAEDARLPAVSDAGRATHDGPGRRPACRPSSAASCSCVASIGWWLDTRVIDDAGFADVVDPGVAAPAGARLHRRPGDAAARPDLELRVRGPPGRHRRGLGRDRHAAGRRTRSATSPIRAHEQVFEARAARRVDIDAQQASTRSARRCSRSTRRWRRSCRPTCSTRRPRSRRTTAVDVLFRVSGWIWLWIPIGLLGIALLVPRAAARRRPGGRGATVGVVDGGLGRGARRVRRGRAGRRRDRRRRTIPAAAMRSPSSSGC